MTCLNGVTLPASSMAGSQEIAKTLPGITACLHQEGAQLASYHFIYQQTIKEKRLFCSRLAIRAGFTRSPRDGTERGYN